jgi:transcriptional regulator with XRE-family HTH domain
MAEKIPNPIDRHVGTRVRMRRMMLAMTQTDLGDALGLTFQQVQKYETGTNRVCASRLQHISHVLQVPVAFFFEGAPHQPGRPKGLGEAPSPATCSTSSQRQMGSRLPRRSCASRSLSSGGASSISSRRL